MTMQSNGFDPLPPPKPPAKGIGPDAWWNPLSPSWPPTRAGRGLAQAARDLEEKKVAAIESAIELAAGIDPIAVATSAVGEPTWGYYVPTVGLGLASLAVLGLGAFVYSKRSR